MNILIVTTHLNTGGITSYILTLVKSLTKNGVHNVFVVSSGGDRLQEVISCGAKHVIMDLATKSELSPKIYRALSKICRLIKEKNIDIIHAHTRVTQVLCFLASKITHKPYVSTCHGFFKKRLSRRMFPCWGKQVIAISTQVQDHLKKDFNVGLTKSALIHNGIDFEEFSKVTDELRMKQRQQLELPENAPIIGNIARLSDVKGQDVLIKAMAQIILKFPRAILVIVGTGKMEEELKRLTAFLSLQHCIRFYPTVSKTARMLLSFDIFVMPSLQEGLGLSVLEAQAVGLPVIASHVGGIPNIIEDGKTGILVQPKDADILAAALCGLMGNKQKAEEIGLQARLFVRKNFSADTMVEKTVQFYQNNIRNPK